MIPAIIYSPFLDWTILKMFVAEANKSRADNQFVFEGSNELHQKLLEIPFDYYVDVPKKTSIFNTDSVIGGHEDVELFKDFIKRNNFSLEIPIPPAPTNFALFLSSAAIMNLVCKWPEWHHAKKNEYTIPKEDSFSGKDIFVNGFTLSNMSIGKTEDVEVSARIDLDNGFQMELFDIGAFKKGEQLLRDKKTDINSLMSLETYDIYYDYKKGYLYCPCVDVSYHVLNHLADLKLKNKNFKKPTDIKEIVINYSELLGKLELSEWGVKAKVEVVARGRIVYGSSFKSDPTPVLQIRRGLVVKIRHQNRLIYIGYVPQELFNKK